MAHRPLKALTPKHEHYCLARVAGRTPTAAAREVGYTGSRANRQGYELDRDPLIAARMAELRAERFKALQMDADEILARAAMIARADPRAPYDEHGKLRPLHELTDEEAAGIAGVETVEEWEGTGKKRVKVGTVRKVRLRDPMPALRLLAEHKKLVKAPEEGLNALAGAIADRLKAARERKRQEPTK